MLEKLYYMHPINTYGTELEAKQLAVIAQLFPEHEIINPSETKHQEACEALIAQNANPMPYFIGLASQCRVGVLLPFRDGKLGAGVFAEAVSMLENGCKVFELTFDLKMRELGSVGDDRRLTIAETLARIQNIDGSSKPH